jgi:hypothetical protein
MSRVVLSIRFWRHITRVFLIAGLVFVSSYCTDDESQTEITALSEDEAYLVETYVKLAEARDLRSITYFKSESLFAAIDSTIDTLRIANTIRALDTDPERWILVFRSIEETLGVSPQGKQGRESEQRR